jgi:Tol biopolymer transport system component
MTSPAHNENTPTPSATRSLEGRLDSWKEIAAYLGRGVRTVQRWEREEGLPVHRLAHDRRGTIYARREELSEWWDSRRVRLAQQPSDDDLAAAAPAAPRFDRVTRTSTRTECPALSSDARLIAYVSDGGDDDLVPQIWVQQVEGSALQLTEGDREYSDLSFSPNDTHVLFTRRDDSESNVYEIPTLGGETRLVQRAATNARFSPNGQWLATIPHDGKGIRIAAPGGAGFRTIAPDLIEVVSLTWRPDSRAVLVQARSDPAVELDWWVVPIDGTPRMTSGLIRRLRESRMFVLPMAPAWIDDALVFSAVLTQGICLYRQRIVSATLEPIGPPEQLTLGGESALLPTVGGGRIAFVSRQQDANFWSVSLDPDTGMASGALKRLTRGAGIVGYLSLSRDLRTLAYFSVRRGAGDVYLRDLETGTERVLVAGPGGPKSYPAISPDGSQVAFGQQMGGERTARPIFIAQPSEGTWRTLGDDCRGRPRQWIDERLLIMERYSRLNSIALIDTETAEQRELLRSDEWSLKNPRVSPDGRWIAFDGTRPGGPVNVYVAAFRPEPIAESDWICVERSASHPFWSADGAMLYYTPMGASTAFRSLVRARRFPKGSAGPEGEPIMVYATAELVMPAYLPGTAPIATTDQIICALGDYRGDVWLMDL